MGRRKVVVWGRPGELKPFGRDCQRPSPLDRSANLGLGARPIADSPRPDVAYLSSSFRISQVVLNNDETFKPTGPWI